MKEQIWYLASVAAAPLGVVLPWCGRGTTSGVVPLAATIWWKWKDGMGWEDGDGDG